jgi:NADH dehydrogenase, FAD-containing subunit
MAEVTGIDAPGRVVATLAGHFPFDFLVIATGAADSYFGHDDWAVFAPGLKSIEDATRIRRRILSAFEQAELAEDENKRRRYLTFVIVGGGPTGVEMAGAIAEIARQTLARDFRRIDPRTSRIILIEAGQRLLPTFSQKHSNYAREALIAMGVDVMTSSPVTRCDAHGVDLADGEHIDAGTVIWAAGIVASRASDWLSAEHDRAGRVIVRPDLSLPEYDYIFVIGDTAAVKDGDGRPVPGLAAAAKQMGHYVGKLIAASYRRPDAATVSIPKPGSPGHNRTARRRGRTRTHSAEGLSWLAVLGGGAHLLSHRPSQSFYCGCELAVELHHLQAWGAPHYRGSGTARRLTLQQLLIGWSTSKDRAACPVIDKSHREDGTFSHEDFIYDEMRTSLCARRASR